MTLSDGDSPSHLTALPRGRLLDRAVEAIKDYVIANGLPANARLPSELELAQRLGVSRNVVRQALTSLEAIGIVRTEHGRGTFVAELGAASSILQHLAFWLDIAHLDQPSYFETRAIFDAGVLELAIRRATDDDLDRLESLVAAMESAPPDEARAHHRAFHLALFDATDNRFLSSLGTILYHFFWDLAARAPNVRWVPPEEFGVRHRHLVAGLRRRDLAAIPDLVAVHLGATALAEIGVAAGR